MNVNREFWRASYLETETRFLCRSGPFSDLNRMNFTGRINWRRLLFDVHRHLRGWMKFPPESTLTEIIKISSVHKRKWANKRFCCMQALCKTLREQLGTSSTTNANFIKSTAADIFCFVHLYPSFFFQVSVFSFPFESSYPVSCSLLVWLFSVFRRVRLG